MRTVLKIISYRSPQFSTVDHGCTGKLGPQVVCMGVKILTVVHELKAICFLDTSVSTILVINLQITAYIKSAGAVK